MDHPAYGIAGRTRSGRASLSSTTVSSPPPAGGRPPGVQVRSPERHNSGTASVVHGGDRGGAWSGCGEERRVRDVAAGRRPPVQAYPVAWRTRSKISSFDVMPPLEARQGRTPADARASDLGMGSDGGCTGVVQVHVGFPVASRTRSKLSFFQAPPPKSVLGVGNDGDRPGVPQVHSLVHPTAAVAGRTRSRHIDSEHREEPGGGSDDGEEEMRDTGVADALDELAAASRTRSELSSSQDMPLAQQLPSSRSPGDVGPLDLGLGDDGDCPRLVVPTHMTVDPAAGVAGTTGSHHEGSGDHEQPGGTRDDGEETEHNTASDGRRPPLYGFPVASRTRSRLYPLLALLQSQSPRTGGSLAMEVFYLESSEDDEPTPSPISAIEEGRSAEGREGDEMVAGVPGKRKRSCWINVEGAQGIAKKTRSHFAAESSVKWQQQPGSPTSRYIVDDDDPDVSEPDPATRSSHSHSKRKHTGGHGDGSDLSSISLSDSAIKGEGADQVRGLSRRWGEFKASDPRTKGKRGRKPPIAAGSLDHCRFLLDDILQKDGEPTPPREAPKQVEELPLVFSFGDEDLCNVAKSEYEQAIDSLWSEFDFAMGVSELGSNCDHMGTVHGEIDASGSETAPSDLCPEGNGRHKLVLDERIGIICEHCSFVELEIRYVPPTLYETRYRSANPNKRSTGRDDDDASILRALGADHDAALDNRPMAAAETKGTIWDLVDPGVKGNLFPHQREGLEFIWRSMAGDILIEKVKNSVASDAVSGGCVITHAPGTGKTRLAIVFLQTFLKLFPRCRPVVLAPRGMLLTWQEEFRKCNAGFPFHIFNEMKRSPKRAGAVVDGAAELCVRGRRRRANTKNVERLVRLHAWATRGDGVLGISYGLFQRLASKGGGAGGAAAATEEAEQKLSRILLEQPGLVIFDEGHTARNERSSIWNVLQKVKTRCRVILSGTPFQNNLRELENVLCLVRPELSGKVFSRAPKTQQQRAEPLTCDGVKEVRSLIRPYVHLHRGSILGNLPGLRQCLIFLNPPARQRGLLQTVRTSFPRRNYMDYEFKVNLASLHPSLLASAGTLSAEEESAIGQSLLAALRDEKVKANPREGAKTMFLMELVRLCASLGEKVLVFSQYREPLPYIRKQLLEALGWDEGSVLLMHGGLSPRERQSCIDAFNGAPAAGGGEAVQVLLASIKACCEGISLVGASRVVLLDTVWNPSVERQAVSRAYRIGQRRLVFTYHLIAAESTGELERYRKQLRKDTVGELVIPLRGGGSGGGGGASRVHEDRVLREMREHEKLKGMFERVVDNPREAMLLSDAFDPFPG